jgi:hypothetical protein
MGDRVMDFLVQQVALLIQLQHKVVALVLLR